MKLKIIIATNIAILGTVGWMLLRQEGIRKELGLLKDTVTAGDTAQRKAASRQDKAIAQLRRSQMGLRERLLAMAGTMQRRVSFAQRATALLEDKKKTPVGPKLQTAYILPHPPLNKGRFVEYESFVRQKNAVGQEMILFREWKDGEFRKTQVAAHEVQWSSKLPVLPKL